MTFLAKANKIQDPKGRDVGISISTNSLRDVCKPEEFKSRKVSEKAVEKRGEY